MPKSAAENGESNVELLVKEIYWICAYIGGLHMWA